MNMDYLYYVNNNIVGVISMAINLIPLIAVVCFLSYIVYITFADITLKRLFVSVTVLMTAIPSIILIASIILNDPLSVFNMGRFRLGTDLQTFTNARNHEPGKEFIFTKQSFKSELTLTRTGDNSFFINMNNKRIKLENDLISCKNKIIMKPKYNGEILMAYVYTPPEKEIDILVTPQTVRYYLISPTSFFCGV